MTAFFTFAYNAAKTIGRTVNSVLNQTNIDWVYYLIDNGATDKTREIIDDYAKKDARIIPIYMDYNDPYEASRIGFSRIFKSDADCFCMVDADDEYYPEFLEKTLAFMEEKQLDAVACGNDFMDAQTLKLLSVRKLAANLVLGSSDTYNDCFAVCYQFFRTIWGKLYKVSLFQSFDFTDENWAYYKIAYGGDTLLCLKAFSYANRVGVLGESLHKYYISQKSVSYNYNSKRVASDNLLFDTAHEFLMSKVGGVSPRNEEFLLVVYMNALRDTLKVLLNAELGEAEKLDALREMFLCEHARTLAARARFGALFGASALYTKLRDELFAAAAQWLLTRKEVADEQIEGYCELGEFLCAACENADGWIFFKKLLVQYLVSEGRNDEAKPKIEELLELLPKDEELLALL
jgi:glycosyltransferase involved in cell wall biosynthesis